MKLHLLTLAAAAGMVLTSTAGPASPGFQQFITVRDGQLMDGSQPFRFVSLNIPNLLIVEDNVPYAEENPWRLPDKFEINDALSTIAVMGGTVTRTYVISVQRTNDASGTPRHVLAPGKFNEAAFRTLDEVFAAANRTGVRLIIPFVDNWPWMGGRAEYAGWRSKTKDDFWTDPQLIADFKQTIHFILTRTNTVTGVRYSDDKAVLCWETGNEIASPPAWTREIAHYIKSLDTNHLVMDGFNASVLRDESLEIHDVDIVTTHHYPGNKKSFAELIHFNADKAKGKKPYVVGEFGFVSTAQMADAMAAIADSSASGGLLWSLRFRNRDGGFYWHSEPGLGGNLYKAFHWPGSTMGTDYDETSLMAIVRTNAFAIRGIPVPSAAIPAPPKLLPIADAAAISWQGSVGASSYQVERAAKYNGDWQIVSSNIDEAFTQYRPQFADEIVPAGEWFYRVRAKNESGLSEPSNIVGPVKVKSATLVDELADFSKINLQRGDWQTADRDCRSAKEDAHRAAGKAGDVLLYQLPNAVQSFRVFAFFPKEESDVKFSVSNDGHIFHDVTAQKKIYFHGAGEYGYWKPVLFHAEKINGGNFLKIELTGETQIGRVEITPSSIAKMIKPVELEKFSQQVSEHLFGHYLPFWCGPALDKKNGGWMAWLTNDLKPDRTKPKGLIVNTRILWAFSAVQRARPEKLFQQMAERAFEFVMNKFWDAQHGGAFWRLDDTGKIIDDSKKTYGQAFYIYALTEFHLAFGNQAALDRAKKLFELIERHAHDAKFGGYLEVCNRDWSPAGADARLGENDMNEKKSMNNHLHVLEAYTNLYRVWRETRLGERLRELIELFLTRILDERTKHLHHFFNEQWEVRSNTYTFGHDIEASWLLCEAAEELGDEKLLERVRIVASQMAETIFNEGFSPDGGLCYEGRASEIIDAGRECWPQAEAMVGFLNAFTLSGDGKFLASAVRVWSYIGQHLVDRVHGEWFWRINPDGQPDKKLPKVSEWKGPYHATRACLETLKRLRELERHT